MVFIKNFIYLLYSIKNKSFRSFLIPFLLLIILFMLIFPLPSLILDIFLTFNIFLSVIILIVSMFTKHILDFSSFPVVLLFSTLLRLSLNVASTRRILLTGHLGSYSAGYVINSFGHFLIGDNFFIGIITFLILVIINFFVVTKGSGRIAAVSARFILDSMPGKQISIDSDLSAGTITKKEAKIRRIEVSREADFYGSMDGASKFVRGDAISGLLIIIINILGGLIIGIFQHNMLLSEAIKVYSILTIGDGLVAQIPALIISIATGVIVTRVSTKEQNVGEQMILQIFNNPKIIFLSGIVVGILGLIPGMPNFIFLLFTCGTCLLSFYMYKLNILQIISLKNHKLLVKKKKEISWDDIKYKELIIIELNTKLFQLSNSNKNGKLIDHIKFLRKSFVKKIGFLPPLIYVHKNSKLLANHYRILIKGVEFGQGKILTDKLLAIPSMNSLNFFLNSIKTVEPIFKLPAFWIDYRLKEEAERKKLIVLNFNSIIITHLNFILENNSHEFLGFQETKEILDCVAQDFPALVKHLVPNIVSINSLQKILKILLKEKIFIHDMKTILETLIEYGAIYNNDIDFLIIVVRESLKRFITQKFFFKQTVINVIGLNREIEDFLLKFLNEKRKNIEPNFAKNLILKVRKAINYQKKMKFSSIIIVHSKLRLVLFNLLSLSIPNIVVLSYSEILEDRIIRITYLIEKLKK